MSAPSGRGGIEHYPEPFRKYGHLRLLVGLEDADDLIADISRRPRRDLPLLTRSVSELAERTGHFV